MEFLALGNWAAGLGALLTPLNLLILVAGVVFGIVFGVLPGLGPMAAMAAGLPFTYAMEPITGVMFLAAIFISCGAADAIPSILLSTPGGPGSVSLTWDGHKLASQGRGAYALGLAAGAGFVGTLVGWLMLVLFSAVIVALAMYFGPAEYVALALMGLMFIGGEMSGIGVAKSVVMGLLGILLGTIGRDEITFVKRFTLGSLYLEDGLPLMAVVIGLFALSEAFLLIGGKSETVTGQVHKEAATRSFKRGLLDCFRYKDTILRSMGIGTLYGILPAIGPAGANVVSYNMEVAVNKGEKFGSGNPRGVIAPEVSRGSCSMLDMLTTFSLGIPGSPHGALFLASLMIYGIEPGTRFFQGAGVLPYALYWSFLIASLVYLVVTMFTAYHFAAIIKLPPLIVGIGILVFGLTGVLVSRGYVADVLIAVVLGVLGLIFRRYDLPIVSLILGLTIGPLLEGQLRRGLLIGGWSLFVTRPVAIGLFVLTLLLLWWILRTSKSATSDPNTIA